MASDQTPSEGNGGWEQPSAGKKKRLQQMFEHANRMMAQDNFDYATELLTQCVVGDPSNFVYLQAFLANLKKKYNNNKKGSNMAFLKQAGLRRAMTKAAGQKDWIGAVRSGVESLKLNPWEVPTLVVMAEAVKELGGDEVELVYLRTALEVNSKDYDVNWRCAQALKERQQFDQAIACLHRCEQVRPGDEDAQRAIASLAVEKTIVNVKAGDAKGKKVGKDGVPLLEISQLEKLERDIARHPDDLPKYVELSDLYMQDELYDKAEEVLAKAYEVSQGDIDIREKWEEAQMRRMRNKLLGVKRKFDETHDKAAEQEYKELRKELNLKELEVYKARSDRYPNILGYRYDLAVRYQQVSRYTEAIAEFQLAQKDPKYRGRCMLALGQCFQHIKQLQLAMRHYESAIEDIPDRDIENKKLSLYRAGKLALGLNEIDAAERHLTRLAQVDFSYKDVAELLEKITKMRKDSETPSSNPSGDAPPNP